MTIQDPYLAALFVFCLYAVPFALARVFGGVK